MSRSYLYFDMFLVRVQLTCDVLSLQIKSVDRAIEKVVRVYGQARLTHICLFHTGA